MKKFFVFLLGCSLLLFPGCKKKELPASEDDPQTRVQRQQIVFYNLFDPEDTLRGQIQAFESNNKDIDVVYKNFHNPTEYEQLVLNELAEGRGPDIFAIRNDWLPNYQRKLSPAPTSLYVPEKFAEVFLGAAVDDLVRPDDEGTQQIWGIPLYIDTLAIYYNKQLFRDNLPATNKPGETWTDIKEQVFGLTKNDNSVERFAVSGIAMGHAANISHFADILSLLLVQEGADLFESDQQKAIFAKTKGVSPGTGKPFYPTVEALKLYTSFALPTSRHVSWNLPITGLYPEQKEVGAFARGKVAMIFGFSSLYNEVKIAVEGMARTNEPTIRLEDIGIAPVPQFAGSREQGRQDAFTKYYFLGVSRNSRLPDRAWDLLNFLTSPESLVVYHEKTNKPTSRLDMVEEQSTEPLFGVFARQASYAKSLQTVEPQAFFDIFTKVTEGIVKNRITVEQGVQQAERQFTCVLNKRARPELGEDCFTL